jgi:hypothetical protein
MDPYLLNRKKLAHEINVPDLFDFIDHWPLFAGVQNISRFLYIYETLKALSNVKGDIVELGSWKGANLLWMAKVQSFLGSNKKIHCFDSFQGLTEFSVQDTSSHLVHKYQGDEKVLRSVIDLYEYNALIQIHKGLIEHTVPVWSELKVDISLIYFDADLYEAASVTLNYLAPRLSVGGIILFDEYGSKDWPGETKAVDEFLKINKGFETIVPKGCVQPTFGIKKL